MLKGAEFRRVFEDPRRSSDRHFIVLARPSGLPHARLGLAVSKRRLRKATARNRVKRIIRESFRKHRELLRGLDLVVMVRPGLEDVDNAELFRALEAHWRRLARHAPT